MTLAPDLGSLGDLAGVDLAQLEDLACRADLGVFAQRRLGYDMAPFHLEWCHLAQTESRLAVVAPREHPLALDTRVMTPTGYVAMGELREGDAVIGGDGTPTRVTALSPIYPNLRCHRLVFDDDQEVIASSGHRWTTHYAWRGRREVTTEQIAQDVAIKEQRGQTHVIDCVRAETEDRLLPLDPWLLGYWLGNGSRSGATLSCHEQDAEHLAERVRALGYGAHIGPASGEHGATISVSGGLFDTLRAMKLVGDKHVPDAYLWAGTKQRLELLAGFLDADGTCSSRGQVTLTQKLEPLTEAVTHLIMSLGWKPKRYTARAKIGSRDYGPAHGVSFYPDEPVFTLTRKTANQRTLPTGRRSKATGRAIVSAGRTLTVPTRCITTEAGSFLIEGGIATLNSKTESFTVNATTWRSVYTPGLWTYVFSQTLDQAKGLLARLRDVIESVDRELVAGAEADNAVELTLANGARITVAGAGKRVRSAHPDVIIGDDVLDDEGTATAHQRRKTARWWYGTVTNMAHPGTSRVVRCWGETVRVHMPPTIIQLVGTPFHGDDLLLGMKGNPRYAYYRYAAECPPELLVPGTCAVEVACG